jgi:hypothetical protein
MVFSRVIRAFFSLRMAVWLLLAQLILMVAGAVQMPAMPEYGTMNALPLFEWLAGNPASVTWWIWGLIGLLALLTANTILCSVESVVKKRERRNWLLVISPQVIHIGFLFVLLAHLVTSAGARHWQAMAGEGMSLRLPNQTVMKVEDIDVTMSAYRFATDWRIDIAYAAADGRKLGDDYLAPNRPSFHEGLGVYAKEVKPGVVLLEVSREPGALWALIGGVLFTAGTVSLFLYKIRKEG